MKIFKAVVCAVFICFSAGVQAGAFFVGGGINNNSYGYTNVENSTGSQIYAGYYFDPGLFVEVEKVDLGDADITDRTFDLEMSGMAYYVGYKYEESGGFGWYAKGGMYSLDTKAGPLGEESSSGLALGGGVLYAFNRNLAMRAGLHMFVGVEDFDQDEGVVGGAISLEARF